MAWLGMARQGKASNSQGNHMEQRSEKWFNVRKGRVTGSSVGAILGHSPWSSPDEVMRRMVREWHGAPSEFEGNIATTWGTSNENGAIQEYSMETNKTVEKCGFFEYKDWLGASPDGLIGSDGLIEVKCPFSYRNLEKPIPFKTARDQMHYYAQIQIQLLVTDRKWCDFYQWAPAGTSLERVDRDDTFIDSSTPVLFAFWNKYLRERENAEEYIAPKRALIDTPRALQLLAEYDDTVRSIDAATERKKEIIDSLVQISNGKSAKFGSRNLTLVKKEGSISYAKAIKSIAPEANLEPFRGLPSEYWLLK